MFSSKGRGRRYVAVMLCVLTVSVLVTGAFVVFNGGFLPGDTAETMPGSDGNELCITPDHNSSEDTTSDESEQLVVRFDPLEPEDGTSQATLEAYANETQAAFVERFQNDDRVEILDRFWVANAVLVEIQPERIDQSAIEEMSDVDRVHENFDVHVGWSTPKTDPGVTPDPARLSAPDEQLAKADTVARDRPAWGVEAVQAPEVWEQFDTRGEGVTVAVLDTGVDPGRADLTVERWVEFDETGARTGSRAYDPHGHGTHVAGTVLGDDASGTAIGVAPEATLYGVKVTDDDGVGTFAQFLAGIEWATDRNADIIQMSLGSSGMFPAYYEPVTNALEAGTLVVAASGNDGQGTSSSPANLYETLSVGAVDENLQVAPFSSGETVRTADWQWRGEEPADWPGSYVVPRVTAPGVSIPSALAGTERALSWSSGTSMAAPHVSGVAALMLAATADDPEPVAVTEVVTETSVNPRGGDTPDDRHGHGIVDALAAVNEITDTPPARATFDVTVAETNSPVKAGAVLEIEARVTNSGTAAGTQSVELHVNGIGPIDARNVTLDPGETTSVTLRWQTTANSAGAFTARVTSEDGADSRSVTVNSLGPAQFEIETLSFEERVTAGDAFEVDVTVRNTGDVQGNQEVSLDIAGERIDAKSLLLDAGDSETVTLTWPTADGDEGERTFSVSSFDDERSGSVTVEPVVGTLTPTPADANESGTSQQDTPTPDAPGDASGPGFLVVVALLAFGVFTVLVWNRQVDEE